MRGKLQLILLASIAGSGAVFLESTAINVALPAMARDFGLGIDGLQWIIDAYLLTLSALILPGGALGDRLGRARMFAVGAGAFAITSVACALAPNVPLLVGARLLQGAAGALLVPNSLALLESSFEGEARATAIGRWAGWSGITTALGPLLGGTLVEAFSWRWVFVAILPLALAASWLGGRAAARTPPAARPDGGIDWRGASLVTLALAGVTAGLVAGPRVGFGRLGPVTALAAGVAALVAFLLVERHAAHPMLPLAIFRSRRFTGANLATLLVYAALSGVLFLLMLQLQGNLAYSALEAGAALLPVNFLLLLLSPYAGRLANRRGPHWLMTVGALTAAAGMLLLTRVHTGRPYLATTLPALLVFGLGLAALVAPLTAEVLGAVSSEHAGLASGVNNACARVAGLLAVAALPLAAGIGGSQAIRGERFAGGYTRAMVICAALCAAGAGVAFLTAGREGAPSR